MLCKPYNTLGVWTLKFKADLWEPQNKSGSLMLYLYKPSSLHFRRAGFLHRHCYMLSKWWHNGSWDLKKKTQTISPNFHSKFFIITTAFSNWEKWTVQSNQITVPLIIVMSRSTQADKTNWADGSLNTLHYNHGQIFGHLYSNSVFYIS